MNGRLARVIVVVVPLALTAAMQMQLCNDNDYLHRMGGRRDGPIEMRYADAAE